MKQKQTSIEELILTTNPTTAAQKLTPFICRPASSAATEDAENGGSPVSKKVDPEVLKSHDVSESSSGSEPSGLNHSGEEQNSGNYVGEPETTALVDASERSVGSEFVTSKQGACLHKLCTRVFDILPLATWGHIDTTSLLLP